MHGALTKQSAHVFVLDKMSNGLQPAKTAKTLSLSIFQTISLINC